MKLTLRQQITQFAHVLQTELFPILEEEVGELDETARRLIATLELIPLARFVPACRGWIGRPRKDRLAIACALVAKAVYGLTTTRQLIGRLEQDAQLRRLCGWDAGGQLPDEATFSRAFSEFAAMQLPHFVHEALIAETQKGRLIGHISRDSTAIPARERLAAPTAKQQERAREVSRRTHKGKRGAHRRYKGGKPPRKASPETRLGRQRALPVDKMLAELPRHCSIGVKTKDGNQQYWRGYKLHLDVADGQIPITALLTSASLHDSQAAIPMATITAQRVTSLYDVMDAAYDAYDIREHSASLGHVPIIRPRKRKQKEVPFSGREAWEAPEMTWAETDRFRERTAVERVYSRLKDEFGARHIRVRGASKIMAHLMFGVLALTADQILKLTS
jgi:Transposase DDE domain/Transposase domain (DUF772)